ncbi:MAG: LPS export ABC transporter periplasmic protein LptC [Rhizobiaceae bacterium]|nr:LPS export ABC transporter periplasmic protein LptC [Rhizobiaceae bacterium]
MAQESTVSVGFAPAHANMRGAADFNRARRHSRMVLLLKAVLPVLATTVVGIFVVLVLTTQLPVADVSIDKVSLKEGKLVMEKPKMAGFDKNNRPYDVQAIQAIQDLAQPGKVLLNSIDAKLPFDATSFANIGAISGVYDTKSEKLFLDENVTINGARGMDVHLKNADIDINSGSMASEKPVTVNSENTNISADSISVEKGGDRILFNQRVKMTITRPVERGIGSTTKDDSRQP